MLSQSSMVRFFCICSILFIIFAQTNLWAKGEQVEKITGAKGYVNVGDPAPDFTEQLTDYTYFTLYDYAGYTILINFWTDW